MATQLKRFIKEQRVLFIILIVFITMVFVKDTFLTFENMGGLLISMPAFGMAAIGLTFSLICGELNISMGSIMALSTVVYAMTVNSYGFVPAILITLLTVVALGAFTGLFVAVFKLDSFVVTLSMMIAVQGIALYVSKSQPIIVNDPTAGIIGASTLAGIPVIFLFFLLSIGIAEFILVKTSFGRNLYAVGGDKNIAQNAGVNVRFYKFMVFIVYALFAGLGGLLLITRFNSGSAVYASDAPLSIIPMVIIGGTALSGGKGGAIKTLLGVFLMSLIFNVMSLYNVFSNIQQFVKGAILLVIVVWDKYSANRKYKV